MLVWGEGRVFGFEVSSFGLELYEVGNELGQVAYLQGETAANVYAKLCTATSDELDEIIGYFL
jgi:hypothetical protein